MTLIILLDTMIDITYCITSNNTSVYVFYYDILKDVNCDDNDIL